MNSRLSDLLDNPGRVIDIPVELIPGMLAQLGGLQVMLTARLLDSQAHVVKRPLDDPKPDALITVYQAAERLSFTAQYLYELIRKGQLPVVRNGKYVRILNSDLDAWIERNREKGIESQLYKLYSSPHERNRTSKNQKSARADSGAVGGRNRGQGKHGREMGAGRVEDIRARLPASAGSGPEPNETNAKGQS